MRTAIAAAACLVALSVPGKAHVVSLQVIEEQPFADGAVFGPAGPYHRVRAIAHGELDPAAPANAGVALLDRAPRNARGMVEYDTDVFILEPQDPTRGSHVMLYDVLNRGNKFVTSWLDDAAEPAGLSLNDPRTVADAGSGFVFDRGYTVVWSGWQPEAPTANGGMVIRVPVATDGGRPITKTIRHEFVQGTRGPENVRIIPLPYPVADMQTGELFTRAAEGDPRVPVPRAAWSWMDDRTIQLLPFGTTPVPRHIYDFVYEARDPTVDGIGFAAVRDVVSDLRGRLGTPHVLGFGVSLSGRFLRHFIDLGMNRDEAGARVFDGVLPHIGGAGKVFANEAFAMPGRTATQHEDRFYPEIWAPVGYGPGGMLRDPATDPKIIEMNTSTEYWQKGASLVHTDADGHDMALPPGVRMMLVAGTQHGGHSGTPATAGVCANPRNPNSAGPALRAALVNLEDWVVRGTPPPDSLVPRLADESAVPAAAIRHPAIPGVTWPAHDNPVERPGGAPVDWVHPPITPTTQATTLVAAIDADGNEVAGLRLPPLAVPLGTYTGVNVYKDLPGELCDRDGMFIPFARTRADRERTGDPRPSLEERYAGRDDYVAKVKAAGDSLVKARLLLPGDRDRYVAAARQAPGFQ